MRVLYYYASGDEHVNEARPRFHKHTSCRVAGALMGYTLVEYFEASPWYRTCTCAACDKPLREG